MRKNNRTGFALAALGAGLVCMLDAAPARAWCRSTTCSPPECVSATSDGGTSDGGAFCGIPISWPSGCPGYSLNTQASSQVSFADAEPIVRAAFKAWETAACPGGSTPNIHPVELAPVDCHRAELNPTAGNANVVMFDDVWPHGPGAYAVTTVTYNRATGQILDADMEINSADNHFTTSDAGVQVDLLSVVTHEAGHFLGMAHSQDATAVMWPGYISGTLKRALAPDDDDGICNIYPPAAPTPSCDPTPFNGFSAVCGAMQDAGLVDGGVDAGEPMEAGADAGADDAAMEKDVASGGGPDDGSTDASAREAESGGGAGCGCMHPRRVGTAPAWSVALMAGLGALVRRRRAKRGR